MRSYFPSVLGYSRSISLIYTLVKRIVADDYRTGNGVLIPNSQFCFAGKNLHKTEINTRADVCDYIERCLTKDKTKGLSCPKRKKGVPVKVCPLIYH